MENIMKTQARTAFFLDIDNLTGAPQATEAQVLEVIHAFETKYKVTPADQVYCAATAQAAFWVKKHRPGFTVKVGRGRDGSDLRLLEIGDPVWLKNQFNRVVIGSGDGIFGDLAQSLVEIGVHVEVTCGHGAMARSIHRLATSYEQPRIIRLARLNFAVAA